VPQGRAAHLPTRFARGRSGALKHFTQACCVAATLRVPSLPPDYFTWADGQFRQ
jgi:hypothetical protein